MPLDSAKDKFLAFNWHVVEVDGNNMDALISTFKELEGHGGKPKMVIANTVPGKGVSFMENDYEWHGKPPTPEQGKIALSELEYWRDLIIQGEDR
jgi:transketolase